MIKQVNENIGEEFGIDLSNAIFEIDGLAINMQNKGVAVTCVIYESQTSKGAEKKPIKIGVPRVMKIPFGELSAAGINWKSSVNEVMNKVFELGVAKHGWTVKTS